MTGSGARLALEAFAHTAAYDARIAAELPAPDGRGRALPDEPACRGTTRTRRRLTIALEKVETLRYGENPHQPAARYRRPGTTARGRPLRRRAGAAPGQGALVQQRPRRGRRIGARAGAARPGRRHRQAHEPVRRRRAGDAARRVVGGARGRSGQRVRRRRGADPTGRPGGRRAPRLDLPRDRHRARLRCGRARGPRRQAEPARPRRRGARRRRSPAGRRDPTGSIRTRGRRGPRHVPDVVADDPSAWTCATRRAPTDAEQLDLDLAWRLVRGVTSNAIVLVRDRRLVGMGSGQTSRVDAARQAVAKAQRDARRGRRPSARPAPRTRSSRSPTRSRRAWPPG